MSGKIFINYRRGDDPGFTQALFGRLEQAFQPEQLFMDVDSIKPGFDFVKVLEDQVAQCDIVLAVIGHNWLNARDEAGNRRLDSPEDFVRIEIESALAQDKWVIPVLVGEARMPRSDQLPETMRPLARRNAVRLTHERFRTDTQGLIKAVQDALEGVEAARRLAAEARRAAAEAAQQAAKAEERSQAEQAARERAQARREAEESTRQDGQTRRPAAETAATLPPEEPRTAPRQVGWPGPASWGASRRRLLVGAVIAANIAGVAVLWIAWPRVPSQAPAPTPVPSQAPAPAPAPAPPGPGRLTVNTYEILHFNGRPGGPFVPDLRPIQLVATGSKISWSVDGPIPQWLNVSPSGGELSPEDPVWIPLRLTAAARSLAAGSYDFELVFRNESGNQTITRPVNLFIFKQK